MTLKMGKSESGVESSQYRHSGTLGGALKVSGRGPVAPVPGSEEKRKSERTGVDSGGPGHPGRAREKSFWRCERDTHLGEYVGVRV